MNQPSDRACEPVIVARADHPISRSMIAGSALKVLYRLKDAGYQGFLVGGCVRDLLIGIEPKDFDVATDASPEEVRRLFRNSRLIGRRFRLAHIRFGQHVVEVATFRAAGEPIVPDAEPDLEVDLDAEDETEVEGDDEGDVDGNVAIDDGAVEPEFNRVDRSHDAGGRILRDNVYGTIDQDVWRRDFTCNALYYNIQDFSIWDYVGGVEDVRSRTLRLIGDPETRYREDPVRMLRAVRFEAKLGFSLHEETRAPFAKLAVLLEHIPPARLLDEFQKLFLAGFGQRSFELLREHGLLEHLFPGTALHLAAEKDGLAERLITAGLVNTDRRVEEGRSVTPMFLFAVLLFGPVSAAAQRRFEAGEHPGQAIADAVDEVIAAQNRRIGIPKRFSIPMRELLALQPRFHRREGRRALGFLGHPRFRAAYDFLLLRTEAGAEDPAIAAWWTELQSLPQPEQLTRVGTAESGEDAPREGGPVRRRRRRGGRRHRSPAPDA
ncbi:MAG: polynucleotide adenylyltransferase PcnB [Pseudomonadota bacterium]|nr:polynucleotide adenylyltransferase PcnB [Pseudomonadota bacterium]